ncbi:MAG: YceI family protein [Betaproteobacteria bacterium]|nr:YceI family protein [Betaproteobacteria bacterium]
MFASGMRHLHRGLEAAGLAFLLGLAGCMPARVPQAPTARQSGAPPGFPAAVYQRAAAHGAAVFVLDPNRSVILIHVFPAGPLARLGHQHIVSSRDAHGFVLERSGHAPGRTDLYFPVQSLQVDNPQDMRRFHLTERLSPRDIAATRAHMLDAVLDASRYPYVRIEAVCRGKADPCRSLKARIWLHGRSRTVTLPVRVERAGRRLTATGRFTLRQTPFGITPYEILGGSLRVADRLTLRFRLRGRLDVSPPTAVR